MQILILSSLLVGCGKDPFKEEKAEVVVTPATAEPYSYELFKRDCTTGEHKFETLEGTCKALTDEKLNNNCAKEERKSLFTNNGCEGEFPA